MKFFILLISTVLAISKINAVTELANYEKSVGEAPHWATEGQDFSVRRWFVDKATATCQTFTYLGNGGNTNNFATQEECEQHFKFTPEEQIHACATAKNDGKCALPTGKKLDRWYFKRVTNSGTDSGTCEKFTYNGCGGNANNFLTKVDCLKACQNDKIATVSAVAPTGTPENEKYSVPNDFDCLIREQVDTEDPIVKIVLHPNGKQCIYGAVKKTAKRGFFTSFQECVGLCIPRENQIEACKRDGPDQMLGTGNSESPDPIKERYYYDKTSQMCVRFHSFALKNDVSDFNPSENRFPTLEMCLSYCPAVKQLTPIEAIEVCSLPKAGEIIDKSLTNGILGVTRYFYNINKTPATCDEFKYGGLNGNYNNFNTLADCNAICKTPLDTAH